MLSYGDFFAAVAQVLPTLMIANIVEFHRWGRTVLDQEPDLSTELRPILVFVAQIMGFAPVLGEMAALSALLFDLPGRVMATLAVVAGASVFLLLPGLGGAPANRIR